MRNFTVTEFMKLLTDRFPDPDNTRIAIVMYDQSDVEISPSGATKEDFDKVLDNFSLGDYTWDSISEDWNEAVNEVLGGYRCEHCCELDYSTITIDTEEESGQVCKNCGEESEVLG